ncbi:P-loop containing nucleoside triphosphate hydrolase protein [Apodospora peruviana]|uniref:P-loop containing nucleoside triphosphate hydrolase protein n=1 Tax=Apodospora peruviana TaxID=516989 RepID=A0AAE0HXX5_9PEZI|nr:P-loop containing nucleoside triphosphate hydrolase protein [Apodospora peruviana]
MGISKWRADNPNSCLIKGSFDEVYQSTAYIHDLTDRWYYTTIESQTDPTQTVPSISTDYYTFPHVMDTGEPVIVELWDFPGSIASQKHGSQLLSSFFNAAVICYSIEDEENLKNVTAFWKHKLQNSLIDCPIFVLGMKKDLRAEFPTLGLSFLSERDAATAAAGRKAAKEVHAAGHGECSAKTGENVQPVFRAIVHFVVNHIKEGEHRIQQFRRRDKAKEAVKDTGRAVAKLFCVYGQYGKELGV